VRVLFFGSFLRGVLGSSKLTEPVAAAGTLSSGNEDLARLSLGLTSSLRSLSVGDRAESGSNSISCLGKDAEVETDPPADNGALDRKLGNETRGDADVPLFIESCLGRSSVNLW